MQKIKSPESFSISFMRQSKSSVKTHFIVGEFKLKALNKLYLNTSRSLKLNIFLNENIDIDNLKNFLKRITTLHIYMYIVLQESRVTYLYGLNKTR